MRAKRLIVIIGCAAAGLAVTLMLLLLMSKLLSGMHDESHTSVKMPAVVELPECPAQKQLEFDIDSELRNSRSCTADEDCELLYLGCPFGCDVPVNKSSRERILQAIRAYRQYVDANQCERCQLECLNQATSKAVCENKVCKSVKPDTPAGG